MLWSGGFSVTSPGADFGFIGTGALLGMPMPVWIMLALVAVFVVVPRHTRFGRRLCAVGGTERAARLPGRNAPRIQLAVYTLTGALTDEAVLVVTARLDSAHPNAGLGYELDSIAPSSSATPRSPAGAVRPWAPSSAA